MRTLSKTDTPIGLAILLSVVAWLCLQIVEQLRGDLIITSEVLAGKAEGAMLLQIKNESLTRDLRNAAFSLKCPTDAACFSQAFPGTKSAFAEPVSAPPWNVDIEFDGKPNTVKIVIPLLPPGGVARVGFVMSAPDTRPVFFYNVAAYRGPTATLLPASHPMVFLSRYYFELLAMSLVAVVALAAWWLFNPE